MVLGQFLPLPTHAPLIYGHKNGGGGHSGDDLIDGFKESVHLDQYQEEFEDRDYVPEKAESMKSTSTQVTFTARAARPEGQRNMQESSFSISQEISKEPQKACIRVRNPPGGASSALW